MKILVDADSCPVKDETYRVARRYEIPVKVVAEGWFRVPDDQDIEMVRIKSTGDLDAADHWIVEQAEAGDIVISADILLAQRCLEKDALAVTPRGKEFTPANIGEAVATRELMADLREAGTMTGGPPPFTKNDRSAFLQQLDQMVNRVKRQRR